jgi:hypothetical protein
LGRLSNFGRDFIFCGLHDHILLGRRLHDFTPWSDSNFGLADRVDDGEDMRSNTALKWASKRAQSCAKMW